MEWRDYWRTTEPYDHEVCIVQLEYGGYRKAMWDGDAERFLCGDRYLADVKRWLPYPNDEAKPKSNLNVPIEACYCTLLKDYKERGARIKALISCMNIIIDYIVYPKQKKGIYKMIKDLKKDSGVKRLVELTKAIYDANVGDDGRGDAESDKQ